MLKEIKLTKSLVAIVDDDDFERVSRIRWFAIRGDSEKYYAGKVVRRGKKFKSLSMHRMIMSANPGQTIDHINGNTLDNRRSNLRFCTQTENAWNQGKRKHNSSGFKGVSPARGKWQAKIGLCGKCVWIGYFETPEAAARAYDEAAKRIHGDFARLNFP